jgi:hypothetical protein
MLNSNFVLNSINVTNGKKVKALSHGHGGCTAEQQSTIHFRTAQNFALSAKIGSSYGKIVEVLADMIGIQVLQRLSESVGKHLELQDKITFGWMRNDYWSLVGHQFININIKVLLGLDTDTLKTSIGIQ